MPQFASLPEEEHARAMARVLREGPPPEPEPYWPPGMPKPGEMPTEPSQPSSPDPRGWRGALDEENLGHYLGPHAYEALRNAGTLAGYATPTFGREQAVAAGEEAGQGNYGRAAAKMGLGVAAAAADMIPGEALVKASVRGVATKVPALLDAAKDYLPTTGAAAIIPGAATQAQNLAKTLRSTGAGGPITAYHGSPHDFDRFDLSKIGTGEGAQAYGHGLYFAENEAVARGYRDDLAQTVKVGNKPILQNNKVVGSTGDRHLDDMLIGHNGDLDAAIKDAIAHGEGDIAQGLEALRGQVSSANHGRMYEVAIHADPERFLDWDKPLSAQSVAAKKGYADARKWTPEQLAKFEEYDPGRSGMALFNDIALMKGQEPQATSFGVPVPRQSYQAGASEALREAGIPGIKYLDAGSRTAGDGSRNYVMFDPDLVQILRKYGVATFAALPPAVQALYTHTHPDQADPSNPEKPPQL